MAFMFACLLSDNVSSFEDIYIKLCGLSYMGDTRMLFAENPNKVSNIVNGTYDLFKEIYDFKSYYLNVVDDKVIINYEAIIDCISYWPECLVDYLAMKDTNLANIEEVRHNVAKFFIEKNRIESAYQTLDGFRTNGIVRSVPYVLAKVEKKFKG